MKNSELYWKTESSWIHQVFIFYQTEQNFNFVRIWLVRHYSIKDLLTILAVYGHRNCTILAIYGSRNEWEPIWQFMAPEITISWQFMAPETAQFWWFLVPDSGSRNIKNGAVSGARNCQHMALSGSLIKRSVFLFHLPLEHIANPRWG